MFGVQQQLCHQGACRSRGHRDSHKDLHTDARPVGAMPPAEVPTQLAKVLMDLLEYVKSILNLQAMLKGALDGIVLCTEVF